MKVLSKLAAICSVSLFANLCYADLTITNNTDLPVTAKIGVICSSFVGNKGIVQPHSSLVVSQAYYDNIGIMCPSSCDADVYVSNNCSGAKIATINFSKKDGVSNIRNIDADTYAVNGGGFALSVDGGLLARPWYKLF